nr:hypothetical protein CFP56_31484 [Quercus suber]
MIPISIEFRVEKGCIESCTYRVIVIADHSINIVNLDTQNLNTYAFPDPANLEHHRNPSTLCYIHNGTIGCNRRIPSAGQCSCLTSTWFPHTADWVPDAATNHDSPVHIRLAPLDRQVHHNDLITGAQLPHPRFFTRH